jgi:endonuclease-3
MAPRIAEMKKRGAYVLYLDVKQPLSIRVGSLKGVILPSGRYAYIGSARAGIAGRIRRHKRLAEKKSGKRHWHIDYLLVHPQVRLVGETALPAAGECDISRQIASRRGATTPVPKFGSTDCRRGCRAHLYRLGTEKTLRLRIKPN